MQLPKLHLRLPKMVFLLLLLALGISGFKFAIDPLKRASLNNMFYNMEFPPPCTEGESDEVFHPHCVPNLSEWIYKNAPCEYFGFQYSMEWFFGHVFEENHQFVAPTSEDAHFVFFPHCVSRVYFVFKLDLEMEHWAAIARAEAEYLVPLLRWARLHPLHQKHNGKNFWTVFSMDLGRQDFQRSAQYIQEWSVGQLAGSPTWIQENFWTGKESLEVAKTHPDSCWKIDTEHVVVANEIFTERVQYWYDTVISIPTRFSKTTCNDGGRCSTNPHGRDIELFFAGSPNSCARREAIRLLGDIPGYKVQNYTEGSDSYQELMWRSKYCLVSCGSSHTNNVRLYDVMVHGCIPVIVTDDFQPPLDKVLPWQKFAIFLPTWRTKEIPQILNSISDEKRIEMHDYLIGGTPLFMEDVSAADIFDWQSGIFFVAFFYDIRNKLGKRIGLIDSDKADDLFVVAHESHDDSQKKKKARQQVKTLSKTPKAKFPAYEWEMIERRTKEMFQEMGKDMWYHYLATYCEEGVCINGRPQLDTQFATAQLGCADAETLIPTLHTIYDLNKRSYEYSLTAIGDKMVTVLPGMWLDGGANVGKSTLAWFASIGRMTQHLYATELKKQNAEKCIVCPVHYEVDIAVCSVEPNPRNFEQLVEHPFADKHESFAWYGIEAALGEQEGVQSMAVNSEFAVDEIGSLLYDEKTDIRKDREEVNVITLETAIEHCKFHFSFHRGGWLSRKSRNRHAKGHVPSWEDEYFMKRQAMRKAEYLDAAEDGEKKEKDEDSIYGISFPPEQPVFFLKLDIEGYEPLVARQSRQLFEEQQIKFLVFEYSENAWNEGLKPVIRFFDTVGYFCFLITRGALFPISYEFWIDDYTNPVWSNVFCGINGDSDLDLFIQLYHKDRVVRPHDIHEITVGGRYGISGENIDVSPRAIRVFNHVSLYEVPIPKRKKPQLNVEFHDGKKWLRSENGALFLLGQETRDLIKDEDEVLGDGVETQSGGNSDVTDDVLSQEAISSSNAGSNTTDPFEFDPKSMDDTDRILSLPPAEGGPGRDDWLVWKSSYLLGYSKVTTASRMFPLERAMEICMRLDASACGGVTCFKNTSGMTDYLTTMKIQEGEEKLEDYVDDLVCTLRIGAEGPRYPSPTHEVTFLRPARLSRSRQEHPYIQWRKKAHIFD